MAFRTVCGIFLLWTTQAYGRHPSPKTCPPELTGPHCSKFEPCKPGYTCTAGYCCRDPVCPRGWEEGGSCNSFPGQPRCGFGFECINGFCCRQIDCPGGWGPPCSKYERCKPGYTCKSGYCCRDPLCPKGWFEGGSCTFLPGQPKCDFGFDCINGFCCSSNVTHWCPTGVVGPSCSPLAPCKLGYTCRSGFCCRDPICPKGWLEGSGCNTFPGDPKCDVGYVCIDGFCCKPTRIKICPGEIGRDCSEQNPCDPGSTCNLGNCCPDPLCPEGWESRGSCFPIRGQPPCVPGFQCLDGFCCRRLNVTDECPKVPSIPDKKKAEICPVYRRNPNECENDSDCFNHGRICCPDICDVKRCVPSPVIEPFPATVEPPLVFTISPVELPGTPLGTGDQPSSGDS